ncbi:MAG: ester cyclase [Pseudomonadota bacterium]
MIRIGQLVATLVFLLHLSAPAAAQDPRWDTVRQISAHIGEMAMTLEAGGMDIEDTLRFEPFQALDEMFERDDVVFLMRHGPTDWSKLDEKDVAPTDCANQRVMVEDGKERMRELGTLLAWWTIDPSEIVVSEWCRNRQTLEAMMEGFDRIDPEISANMPVTVDGDVNLLLSLQGAKDVSSLRERISSWEGNPERDGPLMIITHYTNIEELTQFRVFEGEILVLDPKRDNQVLGYLRLASASPDVGHFSESLRSPLLQNSTARSMIERYYDAIGARDEAVLGSILSDEWVSRGLSGSGGDVNLEGFLSGVEMISGGLSDAAFVVEDIHVAGNVVTVIGRVSGTHTGEVFGIPATGRDVSFGAIAVHKIREGQITESWQMADRVDLIQQIDG